MNIADRGSIPNMHVTPTTWLTRLAIASPLAVFLLVYGPAVGRGFISDDFGWIVQSRVHSLADAIRLFEQNHGFYRPLVALSLAADYALFGKDPLGYGLTNLALCLLCAVLIALTFEVLGLTRGAALLGAAIWLLNFHGINMALLWVSGRSALLLVAAAVGAVLAMQRGRVLLSAVCLALALLSKEEAVLLPIMMVACLYAGIREGRTTLTKRAAIVLACGVLLDIALYAWLRGHSGAMTPATAPPYYQFTFSSSALVRNIREYADRAATFAAAVTLLAWIVLRPRTRALRMRWTLIASGLVWLVCGYGITVFLPSRSSLYACFPSVGTSFVAAETCSQLWAAATPRARQVALGAIMVVPLFCVPVYVSRNHRWVDLARSSSVVLADITTLTNSLPDGSMLVLMDDPARRINIQSMLGTLHQDAITLATGRRFSVRLETSLAHMPLTNSPRPCSGCQTVRLQLRDGRMILLDE